MSDTCQHLLMFLLHILTSHEINALNVSPSDFRNIQLDMKNEIHLHPRLAQPDNLDMNMWAHYSIMHVLPIVMEDFVIVILSIPHINNSLQIDLYRVYNLTAPHRELQFLFSHVLKG